MSLAKFHIDTALWPVVIMRQQGELGSEGYELMFRAVEPIFKRGQSFILITDTRGMTRAPNAAERKMMSVRSEELQEKYGIRPYGSIVIVNSTLIRGALTAMQWLTRRELFAVATREEALDKAREMLIHAGIEPPAGLSSDS